MGNNEDPRINYPGAICTFLGRSNIFMINRETQPREAMEKEEGGLMNVAGGNIFSSSYRTRIYISLICAKVSVF